MAEIPEPFDSTLRWEILGGLASGGMGRVELVRTVAEIPARLYAVKRLHQHLAEDRRFVAMFLDEVWMTGALRHPNVVTLAGWGEDDDGLVLAMELVRGLSLADLWRAGATAGDPIGPERAAYACARVASGLDALHALRDKRGAPLELVHRDVSPSNVLVGFDGSVKLTDFGVARAVGRATNTATGVLKGKVSYMSPEYAAGARVDGRSDLYSLGVCMFELATGERPFASEHDLVTLRLVAEQPAPSITEFTPDWPKELVDLTARLLAKSPADRPPSGAAVAAELDAFVAARGKDPRSAARALGQFAERHGAERRNAIARLVAAKGRVRRLRSPDGFGEPANPDRTEVDEPPGFEPSEPTPPMDKSRPPTRRIERGRREAPTPPKPIEERRPPDPEVTDTRTHVLPPRASVPPPSMPVPSMPTSMPFTGAAPPSVPPPPPEPEPDPDEWGTIRLPQREAARMAPAGAMRAASGREAPSPRRLALAAVVSFVAVALILTIVLRAC